MGEQLYAVVFKERIPVSTKTGRKREEWVRGFPRAPRTDDDVSAACPRVATQGDEVGHLPWPDAVALEHLRRSDARHLAGPHRLQDRRPVGGQLKRIAITACD